MEPVGGQTAWVDNKQNLRVDGDKVDGQKKPLGRQAGGRAKETVGWTDRWMGMDRVRWMGKWNLWVGRQDRQMSKCIMGGQTVRMDGQIKPVS